MLAHGLIKLPALLQKLVLACSNHTHTTSGLHLTILFQCLCWWLWKICWNKRQWLVTTVCVSIRKLGYSVVYPWQVEKLWLSCWSCSIVQPLQLLQIHHARGQEEGQMSHESMLNHLVWPFWWHHSLCCWRLVLLTSCAAFFRLLQWSSCISSVLGLNSSAVNYMKITGYIL